MHHNRYASQKESSKPENPWRLPMVIRIRWSLSNYILHPQKNQKKKLTRKWFSAISGFKVSWKIGTDLWAM
jgi:hypothetical protein